MSLDWAFLDFSELCILGAPFSASVALQWEQEIPLVVSSV
jgi:hypothetical protein